MQQPNAPKPPYIKPVHHRMTRRMRGHNYSSQGTYLITMVVAEGMPTLGELQGDPTVPHLQKNCPYVKYNVLGLTIYHEMVPGITQHFPMVKVWKVCIMPDHIHLILRVESPIPKNKHLGQVIAGFKSGCSKAARELGLTKYEILPNGKKTLETLFQEGYNDKILFAIRPMFDRWVNYLNDNPRRLLIKQQYPQYFNVIRKMRIGNEPCQIIGNLYILKHPEKMAVIYHRCYTDQEWTSLTEQYIKCAEQGGVLVGTGVNPKEKEVFDQAYERGYKIIKLMGNGFSERYKPSGKDFDYCAEGLLLQITPFDYNPAKLKIERPDCLCLNALAEAIAAGAECVMIRG